MTLKEAFDYLGSIKTVKAEEKMIEALVTVLPVIKEKLDSLKKDVSFESVLRSTKEIKEKLINLNNLADNLIDKIKE